MRCQAVTRSVHHLAPEQRPQATERIEVLQLAEDQAAWGLQVAVFPQLRLLKVQKVQVEVAQCLVLGAILRRAAAKVEALQPAEGQVAWHPRAAARELDRPFVEAASLARDLVGPATALPLAEPVAQVGAGVLPQMAKRAAVAPRLEARVEELARAEARELLRQVVPAWPEQLPAARSEAGMLPQGAEHVAVAPQQEEPARAEAEEPPREVAVVPAWPGQRRAVWSEATAWAFCQDLVLPSVQPEPQPAARFARAVARQSAATP